MTCFASLVVRGWFDGLNSGWPAQEWNGLSSLRRIARLIVSRVALKDNRSRTNFREHISIMPLFWF